MDEANHLLSGDVAAAIGASAGLASAWASSLPAVPVPIKNNVLKAFGALISTSIDGLVAKLERGPALTRAGTSAQVALVLALGKKVESQVTVDASHVEAALQNHIGGAIGRFERKQKICQMALAAVVESTPSVATSSQEPIGEISDDWLNAFEQEASNMSSEEMQAHFARILAGEIRRPKSFSIHTVKLMAKLDNRAATLFTQLCSLATRLETEGETESLDVRVAALGEQASANGLKPFGVTFFDLCLLQEYGLVMFDLNTTVPYDLCLLVDGRANGFFTFHGEKYVLVPRAEAIDPNNRIYVNGVALTSAGRELHSIVDPNEAPEYWDAFVKHFEARGFNLQRF